MCIQNTYSCPSCGTSRTEVVSSGCQRWSSPVSHSSTSPKSSASSYRHQLQQLHLSPNYTPSTTPGSKYANPTTCSSVTLQNLLATCQSCTARYRKVYDHTLEVRRSIAMSRCGSSSSSISSSASYGAQDADVDMLNIPYIQEDVAALAAGGDPHERLLESERRNGEMQWERYERMERERLCKRIGVEEHEILFA